MYPKLITELIEEISKFPSIGNKTAEKIVLHLVKQNNKSIQNLSELILKIKKEIKLCSKCFALSDNLVCSICSDNTRNKDIVCIVETYKDLISIEKTKQYRGMYHVLLGSISPLNGIGINSLTLNELEEKVKNNDFSEVIIATNPNTNGETTALYIHNLLKEYKISITKLSIGIPIGSNIEFIDPLTLTQSMSNRENLNKNH